MADLISPAMQRFFEVELRNADDPELQHSPEPSLGSAMDSLFQAPDDVVMDWSGEQRDKLEAELNSLIQTYGGEELLEDFLYHPHTIRPKPSLDDLLGEITVAEVDDYHIEVCRQSGKDLSGLKGWFSVATEEGVVAYFGKESHALSHRLAIINTRLNNIR